MRIVYDAAFPESPVKSAAPWVLIVCAVVIAAAVLVVAVKKRKK